MCGHNATAFEPVMPALSPWLVPLCTRGVQLVATHLPELCLKDVALPFRSRYVRSHFCLNLHGSKQAVQPRHQSKFTQQLQCPALASYIISTKPAISSWQQTRLNETCTRCHDTSAQCQPNTRMCSLRLVGAGWGRRVKQHHGSPACSCVGHHPS